MPQVSLGVAVGTNEASLSENTALGSCPIVLSFQLDCYLTFFPHFDIAFSFLGFLDVYTFFFDFCFWASALVAELAQSEDSWCGITF